MLTNQIREKWSKRFKDSFFMTQMTLVSNSTQIPYLIYFIFGIISFSINISIFFITNPLEPELLNEPFKVFLFPFLSQKIGISLNIFKILLSIIYLFCIILQVILLQSIFMNNIMIKLVQIGLVIKITCVVPALHLMMKLLVDINLKQIQSYQLVINFTFCVLLIVNLIADGCYILFKIRPFRKKSIFWCYNNGYEFYSYLMNIVRVLVIMIDGTTVASLLISGVMQLFARHLINGHMTRQVRKLKQMNSNLSLSVHLGLLVGSFTQNKLLSVQIIGFLMIISFINTSLSVYSILTQQRFFPLCSSQIFQFYDFYFNFVEERIKGNNKAKLSIKKNSENDKILSIHTLNCRDQNCRLKNVKLSQDTYCQDLQNICGELIERKSLATKETQLIYQMWKFETGNKYRFRMQSKEIGLLSQYIVYCALNLSRLNQTSDTINEQSIKTLKNTFYDKLQNSLLSFSLFYEQIAKTQPKLDTLLCVGGDIKQRTNQLKNMYAQLLKHSVINFKTAQVYVQFENFFLKQNKVNQDSIDRLRKIQKSKDADHIEEIYLPTLTSYSQNGLIENMNTECLSFFKFTRFQMKSKNLGSLIYPQMDSIQQIKQKLKVNKNKKLYSFFSKGDHDYTYGSINIKQKYIQNKKFDIVSIEKVPYSDFKNVILVNKETFQAEKYQKQQTYIRPNVSGSSFVSIKWDNLYQKYLKQKIQQLVNEKIVKIRIQEYENSLFVLSIQEGIHQNVYLVNVKFIKDMEKKRNRVSNFMIGNQQQNKNNKRQSNFQKQKKGNFHFFYDLEQRNDVLCLYGVDNDDFRFNSTLNKTKSLGKFQKDLNQILVTNTLLQQNRYTKGIKTYRLWQQQLYNIDLQDKQQYVEQFQGQNFNQNSNQNQTGSQKDMYLISGIFFVILMLAVLSISYSSLASSVHEDVADFYSNALKIQQFRLQMNRIISVTRDMADGRYNKLDHAIWEEDILYTYGMLKQVRSQGVLFSQNQITIPYRYSNYSGTLNQIMDVIIAHVYQFTLGPINVTQIQFIHQTYLLYLYKLVLQQKEHLVKQLSEKTQKFQIIQKIILIIGIIGVFGFYILLGCLMIVLNNLAKSKLNTLMLMSDTEARMNQAMADKLKYAVDMIKKNFDLDLKNIIGPVQTHKQRKKPKQAVIGIQKKICIVLVMIFGFVGHIVLYYKFTGQMSAVLQTLSKFQVQGQNLMETYSTFSQITNIINHFNVFDKSQVQGLRQNVNYLTLNRQIFNYDAQTNQLIDKVFYQDSCQHLQAYQIFTEDQYVKNITCQNALPNYIVRNPFQLGMIAYFSRAHYNVLDNITQTYGSTGVFANPFVEIFSLLNEKIRLCGLSFLQDGFNIILVYNVIYAIFGIAYIFLTLVVIYSLKIMNRQITDLLKFLNYSSVKRNPKKKQEKIKYYTQNQNSSSRKLEEENSHNTDGSKRDLSQDQQKNQ